VNCAVGAARTPPSRLEEMSLAVQQLMITPQKVAYRFYPTVCEHCCICTAQLCIGMVKGIVKLGTLIAQSNAVGEG